MNGTFKFSPAILARLGEELVPNSTDGLLELVKNSYDADASKCTITVSGESIEIKDDGDGMLDHEIIDGWLLIGGSSKNSSKPTTKGRTPAGNKGLGRLAALRLGSEVTLSSRSKQKPGVEFTITINWDKVDNSKFVEEQSFEVKEHKTDKSNGTDIRIKGLKNPLSEDDIHHLNRNLVLLSDPFDNQFGFYPEVREKGFDELNKLAKNGYFSDADFHLKASIDKNGNPSAVVMDWQDKTMFSSSLSDFRGAPYKAPAATFDLWVFRLKEQSFSAKNSALKDVRAWLKVVGGVHLYQSKLRVRPFGEPGHDWLEMDVKRASNPEERPSTNNSIGQVVVDDLGQILTQKTDRGGFVENEAFRELKKFCIDALNWMANKRLSVAEVRRKEKRATTSNKVKVAKEDVSAAINKYVPAKKRKALLHAISQLEAAQQQEAISLKEDLQLYRSVATAGSTSAVFAHESHKPLTQILSVADTIKSRAKKLLGDLFAPKLEEPIDFLSRAASNLQKFSKLPLNLLRRDKRRSGVVDIVESATELIEFLGPFFADSKIELRFTPPSNPVQIAGSRALIESILANLALNALNAFDAKDARIRGRLIEIRVYASEGSGVIKVLDNGPGIRDIGLEEMWLPGRTTSSGGTGFGLTIVRDSVSDLRGTHSALANGELGGAEFTIEIPLIT